MILNNNNNNNNNSNSNISNHTNNTDDKHNNMYIYIYTWKERSHVYSIVYIYNITDWHVLFSLDCITKGTQPRENSSPVLQGI